MNERVEALRTLRDAVIEQSGRVDITIRPRVWLDLVDFAELEPNAAEPVEFSSDSQPRIAFAQGLAQLSAYQFTYAADVAAAQE